MAFSKNCISHLLSVITLSLKITPFSYLVLFFSKSLSFIGIVVKISELCFFPLYLRGDLINSVGIVESVSTDVLALRETDMKQLDFTFSVI